MRQSTCTHCAEKFEYEDKAHGRGRKFCSKRCSSADSRARLMAIAKPCTRDGCTKPIVARMLCSTHYNQTHLKTRHRKAEFTCHGCGAVTLKDASATRWEHTYCSELCRSYVMRGRVGVATKLPPTHMARVMDKTCAWPKRSHRATGESRTAACAWCEASFFTRQPNALTCSRACKKRRRSTTRRALEAGAVGTFTWGDIVRLWVKFDKACAYCAQPTPLTEIQAEHVTALSNGGANNLTNLLPSCMMCNADKRDLTLSEWAQDRKRRGLAPVKTTWSSDDPRYRHLVIGHTLVVAA